MSYVHDRIFIYELVDLKSINMLLKWSKYCARRMKKISTSRLNLFFGRISKSDIILKTDEYFDQKLNSICQKAICTRPYTFRLAILREI